MNNNKHTHIIFDMDGVLLNTEPIYTKVTQIIVGQYEKTFDWTIKSKMIGRGDLDAAQILIEALDLPISGEEYLSMQKKHFERFFPLSEPIHGAPELVQTLSDMKIPLAVATSSTRKHYELKSSKHHKWFSSFNTIVTGDDPEVEKSKPAPDIFLVAARRIGGNPADCLVFEDAPSGVKAAKAAGMSVIAVPDANMNRKEYGAADAILNSFDEFRIVDWI